MDPLNVARQSMHPLKLPLWQDTEIPTEHEQQQQQQSSANSGTSKFPFDPQVNRRVILWNGDISLLATDAIVNSTNEALKDRNSISDQIFNRAGPELRSECDKIDGCRTGEAKITIGCQLPAKYVIHTVGPRYNTKYVTAAESALYNCYRNSLQLLAESHLQTIGLPVINSVRRGFPPEDGAHIALRTVRRFLEKFGDTIKLVVFVIENSDAEIYNQLMPLYYPRSKGEELYAMSRLPQDTGNEFGEPVIEERKIRIVDTPLVLGSSHNTAALPEVIQEVSSARGFTTMVGDHDSQRRERMMQRPQSDQTEIEETRRYQRYLKNARGQDLSDIAKYRMIYQSGVDTLGRPVVLFIGQYFNASRMDLDRALSHFITVMDPIVNKDFVFVYFHTETSSENQPDSGWLRQLYHLVDRRYKRNVRSIYIVHPTFWSKCVVWFFTTFTASNIKEKIINLDSVSFLYDFINPDQLDIPQFILDYDRRINGAPAAIARPVTHQNGGSARSNFTDDL